jgi:esterase/lipase
MPTRLLALVTLALSCVACSAAPAGPRFRPSGVALELWKDGAGHDVAFDRYVTGVTEAIERHRWEIPDEPNGNEHRRLIAPREWPVPPRCDGKAEGVLLLHGLSDSPFLMRDLGDFFAALDRCLLVRSMLLPGHGTAPGDLVAVRYEDWEAAARYGLRSFPDGIRNLYIVGFSTGGAVAIREALATAGTEPGRRIKALILLSPAIRPTGTLARLKVTPRLFGALSRWTGLERWMDVHADRDYAKYESFPTNAAYQIYRLDEALAGASPREVPVPMFMALSREDTTVDAAETVEFFRTRANARSRLLLYARDPDDPTVRRWRSDERVDVVASSLPERGVADFAHVSLPVSPRNPHYGERGDYVNCLHYEVPDDAEAAAKLCQCVLPAMRAPSCREIAVQNRPRVLYGENSAKNLRDGIVRRLTYNPLFDDLLRRIERFLDTVEVRSSRAR